MIEFSTKRTGIALSGGGAKGAFEAGMLRALREAGLNRERIVLAGTSIGAFNSILYACYDENSMLESIGLLGEDRDRNGDSPMPEQASASFERLLEKLLPDEVLEKNTIPVYVCTFSLKEMGPRYFRLNGKPAQIQRTLVRASASIPGVLMPVKFEDDTLCDGGLVPFPNRPDLVCDKIPAHAMKNEPLDALVLGFVKPFDELDTSFWDAKIPVLRVKPSSPLEDRPGSGTLDFSRDRLKRSFEQGLNRTRALLGQS